MVVGIRLISGEIMPKARNLKYIILKPRQEITLNLFESEKYEPAIIIQQLVGTLVYYSNFGRYEPRLAESWTSNGKTWSFKIKKNLTCENGEKITPTSFKKSIERTLFIFEKKGGVPILSSLQGYNKFLEENKNISNIKEIAPIEGIIATEDTISFNFEKKIKTGLLQILSFSPFGYICLDNYKSNGQWLDDSKFISSGPYIVSKYQKGKEYILQKSPSWNIDFYKSSPERIVFTHEETLVYEDPTIIDAFTSEYNNMLLNQYPLVPEYLNSILLGNLDTGYFKDKKNRQVFKGQLNRLAEKILPNKFGVNSRSATFYPNQQVLGSEQSETISIKRPSKPLVIEGVEPKDKTARWHAWILLKATLEQLNFPYKFKNNESSFSEITNTNYDIRIRGSSIGGGVEAWGLYVSFCSSMGIRFPDPGKKVCDLLEEYDNDLITDADLRKRFFEIIEEESAILPISHYGVNLFISKELDTSTFSPLAAIIKFDQIGIDK